MMSLFTLCEEDVRLTCVSSTNGGEYAGPCPGCGGRDRFRVWPALGRFWCRQCNKKGDTITYLIEFRKVTFRVAAHLVGKQLGLPTSPNQQRTFYGAIWKNNMRRSAKN